MMMKMVIQYEGSIKHGEWYKRLNDIDVKDWAWYSKWRKKKHESHGMECRVLSWEISNLCPIHENQAASNQTSKEISQSIFNCSNSKRKVLEVQTFEINRLNYIHKSEPKIIKIQDLGILIIGPKTRSQTITSGGLLRLKIHQIREVIKNWRDWWIVWVSFIQGWWICIWHCLVRIVIK